MPHRPKPTPDRIITAQLDGTARRLLREHADHDTCITELHAITTNPRLLGRAAGTALGAWRAERSYDSNRVAELLHAAGADATVRDERAAETERRLTADRGRSGIGNP